MAKKEWKALLDKANGNLKEYGAQMVVYGCDDNGYALDVNWSDGGSENYASGYYGHELGELINEAWAHVRAKANERGDRIIRCVVHVDTTAAESGVVNMNGKYVHEVGYCGSEEGATRWMSKMLAAHGLNDGCTMAGRDDLTSVNAHLAELFDDPCNYDAYASMDDITEETIVKCAECFCEHHWSHKALVAVAEELGVDLYDIEAD